MINIEKLTINNGSVLVTGLAGNRKLEFENIQGDLSARSILGPWRIDASADVEGIASELKISTGTYQQNAQSIRLKIEASRLDQPYKLLMDGPVKLEDQVLNWGGAVCSYTVFRKSAGTHGAAGAAPSGIHRWGIFCFAQIRTGA